MNKIRSFGANTKRELMHICRWALCPLMLLFGQLGRVCRLFNTQKKQITASVMVLVMILTMLPLSSTVVNAADPVTVTLDLDNGAIDINDTSYTCGATTGNSADVDIFIIKHTTNANYTTKIITLSGTHTIVLQDVNMGKTYRSCIEIADSNTGDITLILEGNNKLLQGGGSLPAIRKNGTDGTLTIKGDGSLTVDCSTATNSAAIGSSGENDCANITIESGSVNITSGTGGVGIGTSSAAVPTGIVINEGTVNVSSVGSASGVAVTPVNTNGEALYPAELTLNNADGTAAANTALTSLGVTNGGVYGITGMKTDAGGKVRVYLPPDSVVKSVTDSASNEYCGNIPVTADGAASGILSVPTTASINSSSLYFREESGVRQYSTNNSSWTNYTGCFKITGTGSSTSNTINVSGSHDIILDGANINTGSCAFRIADDNAGDVTVTLADGSQNTLKSGRSCAGLQKNGNGDTIGMLTIQGGALGTGSLNSTGGSYGAGIGGGDGKSIRSITIESGIITAGGGYGTSGIGGGYSGGASYITINGGTVSATGELHGAGIGGGWRATVSNITITGGAVTAVSNPSGGCSAGIGTGDNGHVSDILISGGTVIASGNGDGISSGAGIGNGANDSAIMGSCSNNRITGGSVKATGGDLAADIGLGVMIELSETGEVYSQGASVAPTYDGTNAVSLTAITVKDASGNPVANTELASLNVSGLYSYGMNDVKTDTDGKIYVYIPSGKNAVKATDEAGNNYYGSVAAGGTGELRYANVSVENSSVYLQGSGDNKQYSTDNSVWHSYTGSFIITGTTTSNTIYVSGSHDIILDNVNIDVSGTSGACAFKIADDNTGDVTVTLADGSQNTLKSGRSCAGLQKNGNGDTIGMLTIQGGALGTGSLNSTGGSYGAGIGGGDGKTIRSITIESGIITAGGGDGTSGIGGGYSGGASYITINGGTVSATGELQGAGIGGGSQATVSNITITGGAVTAVSNPSGGCSAGIGTGADGHVSDILISGGTVIASGNGDGISSGAGIGNGGNYPATMGSCSNIRITGGSVKATGVHLAADIGLGVMIEFSGTDHVYSQGASVAPTYDGTNAVSLTTITVNDADGNPVANTELASLNVSGLYSYGMNDVKTDAEGKIYVYLPSGKYAKKVKDTSAPANSYGGKVMSGSAGIFTPAGAPSITLAALSDAEINAPYSVSLTASGVPFPDWSVTSGSLPAGLTLDEETGVISGTPTSGGIYTFTVTASNGVTPDDAHEYTLRVVYNNVPYLDENGATQYRDGVLPINGITYWTDGCWYLSGGNPDLMRENDFSGTANVILADGIEVSQPSLFKQSGASFNIYAQSSGDRMGELTYVNTLIKCDRLTVYGGNISASINNYLEGFPINTLTVKGGAVSLTSQGDDSGALRGSCCIYGGTFTASGYSGSCSSEIRLCGDYTAAANRTVLVGDSAPGSAWDESADLRTYKYVSITPAVPAFSAQPADARVIKGQTGTFSAAASGGAVSYKWQLSTDGGTVWSDIPGAASQSYTTDAVTLGMNNNKYRCVASNRYKSTVSDAAALTVTVPYLDENGVTQYAENVTLVTNDPDPFAIGDGWYLISGSVSRWLTGSGGKIILEDGCSYSTYNVSLPYLSIYAQSSGTNAGAFSSTGDGSALYPASSLSVYGGNISVSNTTGDYALITSNLTVYGGTLTVTGSADGYSALYVDGQIIVKGGRLNVLSTGDNAYAIEGNIYGAEGGVITATATGAGSYGAQNVEYWNGGTVILTGTASAVVERVGFSSAYVPENARTILAGDAAPGSLVSGINSTLTGYKYLRVSKPITMLPAPVNPAWSGNTASWDAVAGAAGYAVQLCNSSGAYLSAPVTVTGTEYDFSLLLATQGIGEYKFVVKALGDYDNFLDSAYSALSGANSYGALTVSVNSTGLYFREDGGNRQFSYNNADFYTYTGSFTITGDRDNAAANTINVLSGSHDIILLDVNIDVSAVGGACAFKIADDNTGDVTITLADGSVNTLKSGSDCAGLQKNGNKASAGTLTIHGKGSLTVNGGEYGAGIGAGKGKIFLGQGNTVTLNTPIVTSDESNKTVTVNPTALYGAGDVLHSLTIAYRTSNGANASAVTVGCGVAVEGNIESDYWWQDEDGSGYMVSGSEFSVEYIIPADIAAGITYDSTWGKIEVGTWYCNVPELTVVSITANTGDSIASGGACKNINIAGGIINAQGGNGSAGIGGGYAQSGNSSVSDISISGGTVTTRGGDRGAGIGSGYSENGTSSAEDIKITGGSVKAVGSNCSDIGSNSTVATPKNGTRDVFRTAVLILGRDGQPVRDTYINTLETDFLGFSYGMNDVKTDAEGKIYVYIPRDVSVNKATSVTPAGGYYGSVLSGITGALKYADVSVKEHSISFRGEREYSCDGGTTWSTYTGSFIITGNTVYNMVYVQDGTHEITLDNVNMDFSYGNGYPFKVDGANLQSLTLTIADNSVNTLVSGKNHAGLEYNVLPDAAYGTLTIQGGTIGNGRLTSTGGEKGAGIGGGNYDFYNTGDITINSGIITAIGGAGAAGIGSALTYTAGVITINGGTVAASGNGGGAGIGGGSGGSAESVIINGGSVNASAVGGGASIGNGTNAVTPINAGGMSVYLTQLILENAEENSVKNTAVSSLTVSDSYAYGMNGVMTDSSGKLYVYLPEGKTVTEAVGVNSPAFPYKGSVTALTDNSAWGILSQKTVHNIGTSSLYFREAAPGVREFSFNNTDWAVYSGNYTVTGSTTANTINVLSGSHGIVLDNVNIDVSGTSNACAFMIADNNEGDVTITIADGSSNILQSYYRAAGIQKNGSGDTVGTLTIRGGELGTGTLNSTGGNAGSGIGGGEGQSTRNITIEGGIITATGGNNAGGSGIGGGNGGGSASNITIAGGTVKAYGTNGGAGIGSGKYASCDRITISGGIVTAQGGGGTSCGAGIGAGSTYQHATTCRSIVITGGSVKATGGSNAAAIGYGSDYDGSTIYTQGNSVTPKNSAGEEVFLTTITYNDSDDTAVTDTALNSLTVKDLSYTYGMKDVKTNGDGKIFVYLPANKTTTESRDTAEGKYRGKVITLGDSTGAGILTKTTPLTVTAGSGSKSWDGTPLINSTWSVDASTPLRSGDKVVFVNIDSSITEPGTGANTPDSAFIISDACSIEELLRGDCLYAFNRISEQLSRNSAISAYCGDYLTAYTDEKYVGHFLFNALDTNNDDYLSTDEVYALFLSVKDYNPGWLTAQEARDLFTAYENAVTAGDRRDAMRNLLSSQFVLDDMEAVCNTAAANLNAAPEFLRFILEYAAVPIAYFNIYCNSAYDLIESTDLYDITFVPGTLTVDEKISVDITWGDMEFTYDEGTWHTDTHTYDGPGWVCDSTDGNLITVTNNSSRAVDVSFGYSAGTGFEGTSGTFNNSLGSPVTGAVVIPRGAGSTEGYLILTGALPGTQTTQATIGTVTVTVN